MSEPHAPTPTDTPYRAGQAPATPFALVHGSQYHWSWQHLAIVGLAGAVFGFVRYKSGSTAAATLVHTGYNATLFVGFMIQKSL